MNRRGFIIATLAAPAIVTYSNIMPIRALGSFTPWMMWVHTSQLNEMWMDRVCYGTSVAKIGPQGFTRIDPFDFYVDPRRIA